MSFRIERLALWPSIADVAQTIAIWQDSGHLADDLGRKVEKSTTTPMIFKVGSTGTCIRRVLNTYGVLKSR